MSTLDASVSLFQGAHTQDTWATQPLGKVLESIKSGAFRDEVQAVRRLKGKKQAYRRAKEQLLAFTPGCALSTRDKDVPWPEKLLSTTGIVYFDFDHLDDPAAFKHRLARSPSLAFAFISPSGEGLKVGIAAAGIVHPASYNYAWFAVLQRLKKRYPDLHISVDRHVKFLHALCFVSDDPDLYMNAEAVPLVVEPQPPPPVDDLPPALEDTPDCATVASALFTITDVDTYDTWLRVGMALHSTGQPWARPLWDAWSKQSPRFEAKKQQQTWASFSRERDHLVHIGTLFTMAHAQGWQRHTVNGTAPQTEETPIAPTYPWPVLDAAARYGVAGEIVATLEPHT